MKKIKQLINSKDKSKTFKVLLIVLPILLFLTIWISLSVGRYNISFVTWIKAIAGGQLSDEEQIAHTVIYNLRLPRVLAAMLVASAMATAGSAYQGLFKNPLVSPDVLGVSTGACVGAAIGIIINVNYMVSVILAFMFGVSAMLLTVFQAKFIKRESHISLVLSGIIVSAIFTSILGLIKFLVNNESALSEIIFWEMGSLAKITYEDLYIMAPIIICLILLLIIFSWKINIYSLGDSEAKLLGEKKFKGRFCVLLCATLLIAVSVSFSGKIGWVGLTMPQLAKLMVGDDNRKAIPISILVSMPFLILVDTLSRTISPGEIPLAILTGFLSAPIFAVALVKNKG